ncbi:MAG: hypothetical protein KGI84_09965 [Elusimicrobia bacterium]|nr:hypothetical protein [Elusimicrobiota bacterium]
MRLRQAVKLGREMLERDACRNDTFYGILSPEYRDALARMVAAVERRRRAGARAPGRLEGKLQKE